MSEKTNPAPGFEKHPGYAVTLAPLGQPVVVELGGVAVARSENALAITETAHKPVVYIPRADVDMRLLEPTGHSTYCPFKGTARYWSVSAGGKTAENAVWGYDEPYDEVCALKDYVSFYTNKMDRFEIGGAEQTREAPGWIEGQKPEGF